MRVLALVKPHVKTFWVSDRPSEEGLGTERKLVANPRTHAIALQDFSRALMNSRSRENGKKKQSMALVVVVTNIPFSYFHVRSAGVNQRNETRTNGIHQS